ncbi:MAG: glycosyltransferase family 4 protein [Thermoplasmata archaeon]
MRSSRSPLVILDDVRPIRWKSRFSAGPPALPPLGECCDARPGAGSESLTRILWVCHKDPLNPQSGGVERVVHEVGCRLVARGHEVTILSGGFPGAQSKVTLSGMKIIRRGRRVLPHLLLPMFIRENPEIDLIIDDLGHAAPWFSPWLTGKPGFALFYHLHDRTLSGQVGPLLRAGLTTLERLYPQIYRGWEFMTISRASMGDLIGLGVPPDQVRVVTLGVDMRLFHPVDKAREPQLVYFGGMRPYKRPEHSLLVLKGLIERGVPARLVAVGVGPSTEAFVQAVADLDLSKSVEMAGRLVDSDLARVVGRSWLNLHFSRGEGFCLSALEARAAGVPTVAYRNSSMAESVVDRVTGLLVPDNDPHAAVLASERILREPSSWTDNCLAASAGWTWEDSVDTFEETIMNTIDHIRR